MKTKNILLTVISLVSFPSIFPQSVIFRDDVKKRRYPDRPYKRYEAEPEKSMSNSLFLSPTTVQSELQSEATNAVATQLIKKNSYIQWRNDEGADEMVIRFSTLDGKNEVGTKGAIALYINEAFVRNITLDTYWAWQYALRSGQTYPDNLPASNKFARMRFDDNRIKLSDKIPQVATFKLVKVDDNKTPYTIDFIELESISSAVKFGSIKYLKKVSYNVSDGPLDEVIAKNGGKTIYFPSGKYDVANRITIDEQNTKTISVGMWYTELHFLASTDNEETYSKRGIQTNQSNTLLNGLYITTKKDRSYFVFPNNRNGQIGKVIMGSFGSNSTIKNLWIEHFECGGWIDGTEYLMVQNCRFRNHYADGINLASGSKNSVIEHCSFRNNGDDDISSWSCGKNICENNTYQYCTAENIWRASSVGFFGGKRHKALNLVIMDAMDAALRATTDFPGQPFSDKGFHLYENISVYNCGAEEGPLGFKGDIINGKIAGAIHITSYSQYDLLNVKFLTIDIFNSRYDAIYIDSNNEKKIGNLYFNDIKIDGAGRYGISFNNAVVEASYRNISFENIAVENFGLISPIFNFKQITSRTTRE